MSTKDKTTPPDQEPAVGGLGLSDGLGPKAPKRARVCPLQECRGRPRCSQCRMLDEMYPPQRNLSGRGDAPAEAEATIPMARLIELETAEHERDILRTNTQSLAMMLRKCAHRLRCNGHEDLSADVVGLLRRYGLLGSPLRGTETEHG